MRATCPAHLTRPEFITLITFGKAYEQVKSPSQWIESWKLVELFSYSQHVVTLMETFTET
jgi:hypothetical protein